MARHGYLLPTRGIVATTDDPVDLVAKTKADVIELSKRAEATGFDAVWIGDSVLSKPRFEPLTTLAAVAMVTDRVTLGTAVYLPTLRHPVNVAHMTATLDQLSGGRFEFGVGVTSGSQANQKEHLQLDIPFEKRGRVLDEALAVLDGLWSGEAFDFDGEFFDLDGASIGFAPLQSPPIYVASSNFDPPDGFPELILNRLITHGDGWMPISFSEKMYETGLETVRDAMEDGGRDPDELDPAYYQDVVIADFEDEAVAKAREFLSGYYPWELSDEEITAGGAFGTPEQVADHIGSYEDAGVETFVTRFPVADQRTQISEYADVVDRIE